MTTTLSPTTQTVTQLNTVRGLFFADFDAMSQEDLSGTFGGVSRCAFDFCFEIVGMAKRFTSLLKSETPSTPPTASRGQTTAPQEFKNKSTAREALTSSLDEFTDALESYGGDVAGDVINTLGGPMTPLMMGARAALHLMYHCGQLGYIQTMLGDAEIHWQSGPKPEEK